MNIEHFKKAFLAIALEMKQNEEELTCLDSKFGDGDLGVSMSQGFDAMAKEIQNSQIHDLGLMLRELSHVLNEKSPSTLGTILSLFIMGMAKSLRGKTEVSLKELASAMKTAIDSVTARTNSKVGDRTILDSLIPAIETLQNSDFKNAYLSAKRGCEKTSDLIAVHGRAVYYKEQVLGTIDGGAKVSEIIFKVLASL